MATISKLLESNVQGQCPVTLERVQIGKQACFLVTYGLRKTTFGRFMAALSDYESCVLHVCECAGYLDD